jgi:hypothetical protein
MPESGARNYAPSLKLSVNAVGRQDGDALLFAADAMRIATTLYLVDGCA